jgi:DNA-binding transcriptional regulator GbsR (MarR family)
VVSRTKGSVGIVLIAVSQSPAPMTVREIVKKTGLTDSAVRAVLQRNQQYFICVGVDGQTKRWARKDHQRGVSE